MNYAGNSRRISSQHSVMCMCEVFRNCGKYIADVCIEASSCTKLCVTQYKMGLFSNTLAVSVCVICLIFDLRIVCF